MDRVHVVLRFTVWERRVSKVSSLPTYWVVTAHCCPDLVLPFELCPLREKELKRVVAGHSFVSVPDLAYMNIVQETRQGRFQATVLGPDSDARRRVSVPHP